MREYDRVLRDYIALVTGAADFAARRHAGQTRKGTAAEPYVIHLAEVASLLADTAEEPDAALVAAGWLHDTLEDTTTERDELERLFGKPVTDIVVEVTDDKACLKPNGSACRSSMRRTRASRRDCSNLPTRPAICAPLPQAHLPIGMTSDGPPMSIGRSRSLFHAEASTPP